MADSSHDRVTRWTWYRTRTHSRDGLVIAMDREELRAQLRDAAPAARKDDLPLVCPATFRGGRRANADVERVYMLGLDIDDPTADPAATMRAVHGALGEVEVYVYSTHSSALGAYRLRALVPYDAPATGEQHRASWTMVARILARSGIVIDRACSDPARGYYVWSVPPSGAYYHGHIDGHPWPVALAADTELEIRAEQAPPPRPGIARAAGDVMQRARAYVARMPVAISGSGGHAATWAVARVLVADFGLDDEAAMEIMMDYSARCQPPWTVAELRHKVQSARSARVRREMRGR